jgi:hypothetical protein
MGLAFSGPKCGADSAIVRPCPEAGGQISCRKQQGILGVQTSLLLMAGILGLVLMPVSVSVSRVGAFGKVVLVFAYLGMLGCIASAAASIIITATPSAGTKCAVP